MTNLSVSKEVNYDSFREETDALFAKYQAVAEKILKELTREDLLANSMLHPDGFLKMQIGPKNGVDDGQVRLHFWVPGRLGTEQPHSHPWHLASRALVGNYVEYQPKLLPEAGGDLEKFAVQYPAGKDVRAGVVRLDAPEVYVCSRGDKLVTDEGKDHYLQAGPIHMSSPDGLGGVTLAVMSPRFEDRAVFYAPELSAYSAQASAEDIERVMDMVREIQPTL